MTRTFPLSWASLTSAVVRSILKHSYSLNTATSTSVEGFALGSLWCLVRTRIKWYTSSNAWFAPWPKCFHGNVSESSIAIHNRSLTGVVGCAASPRRTTLPLCHALSAGRSYRPYLIFCQHLLLAISWRLTLTLITFTVFFTKSPAPRHHFEKGPSLKACFVSSSMAFHDSLCSSSLVVTLTSKNFQINQEPLEERYE